MTYSFRLDSSVVQVKKDAQEEFPVTYPDWFKYVDNLKARFYSDHGLSNSGEDAGLIRLPPFCTGISLQSDSASLEMTIPEQRKTVSFSPGRGETLQTFSIPFPRTRVNLKLRKEPKTGQFRFSHVTLWVMKDALGNTLVRMPFPNAYDNGTICYGDNAYDLRFPAKDLRETFSYYSMYTDAPFNSDLWRQHGPYETVPQWLAYLSTLDTFPYEEI